MACDEMTQQYQKKYNIEQALGHGRGNSGGSNDNDDDNVGVRGKNVLNILFFDLMAFSSRSSTPSRAIFYWCVCAHAPPTHILRI